MIVIGNPDSRPVTLLREALASRGLPPARLASWLDLLEGRIDLADVISPGSVVRIETPGRDFAVERALLALGASEADELESSTGSSRLFARLPAVDARDLAFDRGRIHFPRQWYLGFRRALRRVEAQLQAGPEHRLMNAPSEIARMFDKPATHALLESAGLPVPRSLGRVRSFEELAARMGEWEVRQVFVKLAHGSSASGAVAYRTDGRRHRAYTTVEVVRTEGDLRLYNTRRVRVLDEVRQIAELVDELCRHHAHVEEWLPKAGIHGHCFDLRVVVIGGRAGHTLARLSRTPMTNLHLLNPRAASDAVRERMGPDAWSQAMVTCEAVMHVFPRSLYAGIDLMVLPGYRRHAVLEVNAFGDLLPGLLHAGRDTYGAELEYFGSLFDAAGTGETQAA